MVSLQCLRSVYVYVSNSFSSLISVVNEIFICNKFEYDINITGFISGRAIDCTLYVLSGPLDLNVSELCESEGQNQSSRKECLREILCRNRSDSLSSFFWGVVRSRYRTLQLFWPNFSPFARLVSHDLEFH
jgi:hypothetical protein